MSNEKPKTIEELTQELTGVMRAIGYVEDQILAGQLKKIGGRTILAGPNGAQEIPGVDPKEGKAKIAELKAQGRKLFDQILPLIEEEDK